MIAEIDERLGLTTQLHAEGPIDHAIPPAVEEDVLAVVREALSNARRHGRAETVEVLLRADADCTIRISDDGCGFTDSEPAACGHGLANLLARAEARGGTFAVSAGPDRGVVVEWRIPLDPP